MGQHGSDFSRGSPGYAGSRCGAASEAWPPARGGGGGRSPTWPPHAGGGGGGGGPLPGRRTRGGGGGGAVPYLAAARGGGGGAVPYLAAARGGGGGGAVPYLAAARGGGGVPYLAAARGGGGGPLPGRRTRGGGGGGAVPYLAAARGGGGGGRPVPCVTLAATDVGYPPNRRRPSPTGAPSTIRGPRRRTTTIWIPADGPGLAAPQAGETLPQPRKQASFVPALPGRASRPTHVAPSPRSTRQMHRCSKTFRRPRCHLKNSKKLHKKIQKIPKKNSKKFCSKNPRMGIHTRCSRGWGSSSAVFNSFRP